MALRHRYGSVHDRFPSLFRRKFLPLAGASFGFQRKATARRQKAMPILDGTIQLELIKNKIMRYRLFLFYTLFFYVS
jgi:hypothetical protein